MTSLVVCHSRNITAALSSKTDNPTLSDKTLDPESVVYIVGMSNELSSGKDTLPNRRNDILWKEKKKKIFIWPHCYSPYVSHRMILRSVTLLVINKIKKKIFIYNTHGKNLFQPYIIFISSLFLFFTLFFISNVDPQLLFIVTWWLNLFNLSIYYSYEYIPAASIKL